MNPNDKPHILTDVAALGANRLHLNWSDGTTADVDLTVTLGAPAFARLRDPEAFSAVKIGDWGHSLEWDCGVDLGAGTLWLETLSANGRGDVRRFLEWRLTNGLSLSKAAEALGLSRRTIAYYSNGERTIPKAILLACKGWEVSQLPKAA